MVTQLLKRKKTETPFSQVENRGQQPNQRLHRLWRLVLYPFAKICPYMRYYLLLLRWMIGDEMICPATNRLCKMH